MILKEKNEFMPTIGKNSPNELKKLPLFNGNDSLYDGLNIDSNTIFIRDNSIVKKLIILMQILHNPNYYFHWLKLCNVILLLSYLLLKIAE